MIWQDLDDALKSELKGHFEELCVASVRPHYEYLARELHDAISGIGTKEEVISEILGVSDNKTIHRINEAYMKGGFQQISLDKVIIILMIMRNN
jgi:hypothetical protein